MLVTINTCLCKCGEVLLKEMNPAVTNQIKLLIMSLQALVYRKYLQHLICSLFWMKVYNVYRGNQCLIYRPGPVVVWLVYIADGTPTTKPGKKSQGLSATPPSDISLVRRSEIALRKSWYVVDPERNLVGTRATMAKLLEPYASMYMWPGFVGELPTEETFR
jgi:hypothetical protein